MDSVDNSKCGGSGRHLHIGHRYLVPNSDSAGYKLSGVPQELKFEEIQTKKKGVMVFRIHRGDNYDFVCVGIISNLPTEKYDPDITVVDHGITWVAGDEDLFIELSNEYGCYDVLKKKEIVCLAPLFLRYPKTATFFVSDSFLLGSCAVRAIRLSCDMRIARGLNNGRREYYNWKNHPHAPSNGIIYLWP